MADERRVLIAIPVDDLKAITADLRRVTELLQAGDADPPTMDPHTARDAAQALVLKANRLLLDSLVGEPFLEGTPAGG